MGTVNIFLGGTGKHIAEDIQDSRDFYGLSIGEPVAFDLDAATRAGVDLRGFVHPSQDTINGVGAVARGWAQRQPGPEVGPADDAAKPGPQCPPEHSVLVAVGKGIAENPAPAAGLYALRGHGLTVFSALFDPRLAIAGAGDGHRLRTLIANRVREARDEGGDLRVNLVTSTAGGTGAGTAVPLALWLREQYPGAILTLLAVTPTAFASVLRGNPNSEELAAKGRSGTYAMFRELSFLQSVDPEATFSARALPATDKGLEYAPGQALFDRVYWFGGREGNEPRDAFEEAGALLRILSSDNTAAELRGKTGNYPLMSVGAVTAIEYPRLRLQRKLVSRVLVAAYERLRAARPTFVGGASVDRETSLLDYVDSGTGRGLGAWFSGQRFAALALDAGHAPLGEPAAAALAGSVRQEAGVGDYASVLRGARIPGGNYDAGENDWKAYQAQLRDGLDDVSNANQRRLDAAIPRMRAEEESAFAEWLRTKTFGEWLSGDGGDGDAPYGIEDARALLGRIERDARELETRVARDDFIPGETVPDADARIRDCENKLDKPDAVNVGLAWWQRLIGWGAAAAVFLAFLLPIPWDGVSRFGEFGGTSLSEILVWAGGAVLAILVWMFVRWFFLRSVESSLQQRRKDAEDRLFDAYERRDRVRALRWLHQELCGRDGAPAFFRELRGQIESVTAAVDELDRLYDGLRAEAAAEVARAASNPDHVRATVGDCLDQDQGIAGPIVPQIAMRLRVDADLDPNRRISALAVRLARLDGDEDQVVPASAEVRAVLAALDPDGGADNVVATDVANRWKDALWGLVNWRIGESLPTTFDVALQRCEGDEDKATQALVDRLNRIDFPRRASVDLRVAASDPVFRQLYAGSADIRARFNKALEHPGLDRAKRNALMQYAPGQNVGALGEQIVFLDLWADDNGQPWAPNVISNAVEAGAAFRTYYGADPGAPPRATADQTCFTVIPELLAATKVELGGNVQPLAPAVVARLLGSDLDTQGPTYAELFYLLRARGRIVPDRQGSGPEASTIVRLALDDGREPIGLVEYALGGVADPLFGDGRDHIVVFDAFCDFMRFDGTPIVAGQADAGPFTRATLRKAEWASDARRVARLQRAAVLQWYEGDIADDCDRMVRELEADLADMKDGNREVRESWERAMRRLLDGDERRRIRQTWLRASNR